MDIIVCNISVGAYSEFNDSRRVVPLFGRCGDRATSVNKLVNRDRPMKPAPIPDLSVLYSSVRVLKRCWTLTDSFKAVFAINNDLCAFISRVLSGHCSRCDVAPTIHFSRTGVTKSREQCSLRKVSLRERGSDILPPRLQQSSLVSTPAWELVVVQLGISF